MPRAGSAAERRDDMLLAPGALVTERSPHPVPRRLLKWIEYTASNLLHEPSVGAVS